jgi:hypothetical protein
MRRGSFILTCLAALAVAGCAGYKLGPVGGAVAGEKSVQIVPFANQTLEPRLTDGVTTALRKRFQQDGTYKLATRDDGDIILTGTIVGYDRSEISFQKEDLLTLRDFRVDMTANFTARSRVTGNVILEKTVTGHIITRIGNDIVSAERQALPLLAEDLARQIVSLLTEGSW